MSPQERWDFENLHALGLEAQKDGRSPDALDYFIRADEIARNAGDERKRLDTLNPAAKAMWLMGDYDGAQGMLAGASILAERLGLLDESAIAISNIGRVAAVRIVRLVPVPRQAEQLSGEAVPHFARAREMLAGHDHYYFRYSNAQHGSLAAALAGEWTEVRRLLRDGLGVAFRRSPEPYDRAITYKINPRGLGQMAVAAGLLFTGNKESGLTEAARASLLR